MAQPSRAARTRQAPPAEDPVEDPGPPIDQMPQPQVGNPDEPRPESEGAITKINDLMQPREVEVDAVAEPIAPSGGGDGTVIIRMNTTLEDFTFADPHMHMRLEEGHRYRVPTNIGVYLDNLGYVWH